MGDNGTGDQRDETVDCEQRSGETLGMRGIQVQTIFKHISKYGNNEAKKEGFLMVYRPVSVKREHEKDDNEPANKAMYMDELINILDERNPSSEGFGPSILTDIVV